MKRRNWLVAVGLIMTFLVAACAQNPAPAPATTDNSTPAASTDPAPAPSTDPAPAEPEIKGVIGFSYGNDTAEIYPVVANPAKEQAAKRGYKLLEGAAAGDCEKQVKDIENFITQGVDAIVFLPLCGIDPYMGVIAEAKNRGIVVVGYSTEIPGGDAAILYDNVSMGAQLAEEALRWYDEEFAGDKSKFSWALFTFDQCGKACTDRTNTVRDIIVKATGVQPLEAESVAMETGLKATETFLQSHPDLNMVLGINDAGALGAYEALSQTGRNPDSMFVGGMDGQKEAIDLIADGGGKGGIYRASSALIIAQIGRAVVDLPANILEGGVPASMLLKGTLVTPRDPDLAKKILDTF